MGLPISSEADYLAIDDNIQNVYDKLSIRETPALIHQQGRAQQ